MNNKYILKNTTDLANPLLGTKIIRCTDEFFAPAKRIINPYLLFLKKMFLIIMANGWMDGKQEGEDLRVMIIF